MAKYKDKERILNEQRRNSTYKRSPIRLSTVFSTETVQASRDWYEIFQVMKSKDLQPRVFYPARFSLKMGGEALGGEALAGVAQWTEHWPKN